MHLIAIANWYRCLATTHRKDKKDDKLKFRTEGLLQAGKLLGFLVHTMPKELMNQYAY